MLNRRDLLKTVGAGSALWWTGCGKRAPLAGEFVGPSVSVGHRLRDGFRPVPAESDWEDVDVVVVGGGIAGLAAGRRLMQEGIDRVRVLELEPEAGGTSRSGESSVTRYPWGAHYLPVPLPENEPLISLLDEMGVLERIDEDGRPVVAEQYLCRDPEERLFVDGRWHEGLFPYEVASETDRRELAAFRAEIDRWVGWRDAQGRRAFSIPVAGCSDDPVVTALDQLSMSDWMEQQGWGSDRLRWLVDYSCRDDYGCTIEQTSAWAGLFYFASRMPHPGADSQSLITWPEGNGRIVRHLADMLGERLRCGIAVTEVRRTHADSAGVEVIGFDTATEQSIGTRARAAILAVPQFLLPYLVVDLPDERADAARQFEYGSWLVANLHLVDRPESAGFPFAWDNVLKDSPSLGYVTATHQSGRDHGASVFTYYRPYCDDDARAARESLLKLTWAEAAELILSDLEPGHPDIRDLVERVDVMRWGHAMVRPRTGFVWSEARRVAAEPWSPLHFAGTDLSGVALCEEAFHHGIRAADEALQAIG